MDNSLRILILEDNDLDKKILSLYLERSEINYDLRIVDTEKDFRKGLLDFHPDIVLADYMLPNFNGLEALEIHKSICPDIPFIFVTGQLSEETAIDCLRHGAWDYILKNRIKRLPIAIKSAVKLRHEIREKEKNEIEIRNSELRFRNMIENISDGILIIENDRVTYFNENARNFLELDNTDPTDVNIKHYIPIEKYQKIEAFFRAGEPDTNLFVEFEKHYPSETDFEHCLLVKLSAGISQGHDKNLYFTISDITQKRLQQREESLKFRFTQRISNAQSPEELFEITALTLEEYLQVKNFFIAILQSDTDVISTIYLKDERDMPSQFPAGNTITSKVIKTQELIFLKDADISNLIMEENTKLVGIRSLVWMGVPFQTTRYKGAVVIQDYENENLISKNDIGLIRFITEEIGRQIERKYTFEEIKLSEEKFNRITNSANDAIILMDHMGNVSFWNRAAANLFQYTEDEIIGKNLHDFLAPKKYHQEHKAGFSKFLSTGEGPSIGKTVILDAYKKDGSVVHVELSLSSLKMHGNWNAVGIIRDISERKKQEEEMSRLKTNFLAAMSHELRTPLNGIQGFSEILRESLDDKDYVDMADTIFKSSQRLLNTFNLIIDLSVIEANELKVNKKSENLIELLQNIQDPYQAEAADKNLYLNVVFKTDRATANIDQVLFSQAVNNLLNNAIKYTREGGVTLSLENVQKNGRNFYSIAVSDTGIGISPENISLIYDAFRQASEGYNRAFEGTGLGLHITKRYIDMLDGIIEVESEPDVGSVFTLFIPAGIEVVYQDEARQIVGSNKPEKDKPAILYVEDDPDHGEVVRLFLKEHYNIRIATNGMEALKMAKTLHYDIILMDINLGRQMNGLQVVQEIRKFPEYRHTPIAAVTANAMVTQKDEYLSKGCTHYISKPFTKKILLDYIKVIMAK